jgi:U3 small nucleolar RNA-associated protein 10
MTEATSSMLDKSRSGRKGVQQQNEQDVILRLLPTLNEGLAMKNIPDLRIGCYMLLSVMASKGGLEDKLLTAMMEAVVLGWSTETIYPGLVCLSVLAQHRGAKQLPGRLAKELLKVQGLLALLVELSKTRRVEKLANGLCLALIHRLGKKADTAGLTTIAQIVENQLLSNSQAAVIVKALLLVAHQVDSSDSSQKDLRPNLAATLVTLAQLPGHIGLVVQGALKDTDIDIDELEMKLHVTLRQDSVPEPSSSDEEMADVDSKSCQPSLSALLEPLKEKLANTSSLLSDNSADVYADLCRVFLAAAANTADLNVFDESPLLRRSSALEDSLYFSFYVRTWCGPSPVMARTSAIQMATRCLTKGKESKVDLQALIPYAITALGDPAVRVRRAAAEFIIAVDKFYPVDYESKQGSSKLRVWAFDDIYGLGEETQKTQFLATDVAMRLLRDLVIPALEECTLDRHHIEAVFRDSMNSSKSSDTFDKGRLSQAIRLSIMSFLASHVIHTPLYLVKLRLLASLNQIKTIGSTSRTKVLLPALEQWALFNLPEAKEHCENENFNLEDYNDQAVLVVSANDKDGLQLLTKILHGDIAADRIDLLRAVFKRLQTMWSSLKGEVQLHTAQMLLDSAQTSSDDTKYRELATEESTELLRTSPLSTNILLSFITQLPTAAKLADTPPATKRRRTSHGEVARKPIQDSKQLSAAIRKVTFVLQLIDSSNPGTHPELLKGLFNVLAELQHFKAQVASELAYLQGLVLGSLLLILQSCKANPNLKFDRASVRADLVVDCVQKTTSPQVQNTALLLIASLADAAPELVLHSVMPIFTFMGNSVLRQSDDYSAHVINQTIREVIPPLISSLRKEKGDPVTGAAELLLSFVAAYEHVPSHRRNGLFVSLVQTLGAVDFLFALLAMLVDKYGPTDSIKAFTSELSNSFGVETQLQSVVKYLGLVGDILKPKPILSTVLLSANNEGVQDPHKSAFNELLLLPHLLSQKRLVSRAEKVLSRDDMDAARVRDLYSTLLEDILALADTVKQHKRLHSACGDILESLLGLLSASDFVKSVDGLLDRPNESLRRKILRSLEARIDQESPSDSVSRTAMLGFLPQLTAIIRESQDVLYKHIAVSCVDKISEKFGKKDLEGVAAAAETIASNHCLGQLDNRLRVMALLSLASLVEILREGIVSVLPVAIPKSLEYMEAGLGDDAEAQRLHNAAYAFISSLIQHLPYMISASHLEKLLAISNISAESGLDIEADDSRVQCLQLVARHIDAKTLFVALEKNWEEAAVAGTFVRPPQTPDLNQLTCIGDSRILGSSQSGSR